MHDADAMVITFAVPFRFDALPAIGPLIIALDDGLEHAMHLFKIRQRTLVFCLLQLWQRGVSRGLARMLLIWVPGCPVDKSRTGGLLNRGFQAASVKQKKFSPD